MESNYPQPKWQIGQKVIWQPVKECKIYDEKTIKPSDFDFWCKQYLRHLIKFHRKIQNHSLEKAQHTKIRSHIKDRIRNSMEILKNAWGKEVEIAGIIATYGHNIDSDQFNQCYVAGVEGASSPIGYTYQICIRWEQENKEIYQNEDERRINTLAMITGCGVGADYNTFKEINTKSE